MQRLQLQATNRIEKASEWCGILVAWCVLIMVLIIGYDVSMRFFFRISSGALQELEWHLFAVIFLLGASYTLKHDGHVRVDIFYRKISARRRAVVDVLGVLLFLLPLCVFLAYTAWDFAATSWSIHETSREPGGLPYPMIPLLKSVVAMLARALARLRGR